MHDAINLPKEKLFELLVDFSKRWLAHDGLWFQAVERNHGMDEAIKLDIEAWEIFTVLEAKRIMRFLELPEKGGLQSLKKALNYRLYAFINVQESIEEGENKLIFRMNDCRVQSARKRRGLDDFPCKPVGIVEYGKFAETIDPRIKTKCICCPPDEHPEEYYCAWEFTIVE